MSQSETEMDNEYNFSGGERGKYSNKYHQQTNIIVLEPDVAEHFPNSEAVNQALRTIWELKHKGPTVS
jgi:hypothetical protein